MRKLYTIETARPIKCLGGIQGPLTTPTDLSLTDVLDLLKTGFIVYQCNPYDIKEKCLVTRENVNSITFSQNRATATSKRLLNRSIQEMNKPMYVDVHQKENKTKNEKESNKQKDKTEKSKDNSTKEEKVTTPDKFVAN